MPTFARHDDKIFLPRFADMLPVLRRCCLLICLFAATAMALWRATGYVTHAAFAAFLR